MTQIAIDWSPRKASVEALDALPADRLRDDHRRIMAALQAGPMTDEQIQAVTGISANAERPRRGELVESGRVYALTDRTGTTASGRRATLWAAR